MEYFEKLKAIFVSILLYMLSACNSMTPEKHLIPEGFTGRVVIFYGRKDGQKEKEGKFRLYRVPNDGIVKTKYSLNKGWINDSIDMAFFYVNNKNYQSKIEFSNGSNSHKFDSNDVIVHDYGIVGTGEFGDFEYVTFYEVDTFKNMIYNKNVENNRKQF